MGEGGSAGVEVVGEAGRASRLLVHPLRVRVLEAARTEGSAADLARRLGVARQKVNYHVRELERAGFLTCVGEGRKRNLVERRWVASARTYVLLPQVLGPVAADASSTGDAISAARLLALTAQAQGELGRALAAERDAGERLPTLSLDADLSFAGPRQRAEFARALEAAVTAVIAAHAGSPVDAGESTEGTGEPTRYRLLVGVYPVAGAAREAEGTGAQGEEGTERRGRDGRGS
jgi:DNA-binding transcriptional ArsR family regulator